MPKKNNPKTQKKKSFTSIMVICFMLVFSVAVCTSIQSQNQALKVLQEEERGIQEQLNKEKEKKKEFEKQQDYYTSDDYIESVAREQLGYVLPDEVVFKNREQ